MEEALKLKDAPKVRNFLWKLIKNGLPTNENHSYKHITNDESCEMCRHWKEDGYHAVMMCLVLRAYAWLWGRSGNCLWKRA
jgi:hypothetical protein